MNNERNHLVYFSNLKVQLASSVQMTVLKVRMAAFKLKIGKSGRSSQIVSVKIGKLHPANRASPAPSLTGLPPILLDRRLCRRVALAYGDG